MISDMMVLLMILLVSALLTLVGWARRDHFATKPRPAWFS